MLSYILTKKVRPGNKKRKMEEDNLKISTSNLPISVQLPELEVVPNIDKGSGSEVNVFSKAIVLSTISNQCSLNFHFIAVYESKQLYGELGLHLVQKR